MMTRTRPQEQGQRPSLQGRVQARGLQWLTRTSGIRMTVTDKWAYGPAKESVTRKYGNYSDVLSLKAAQRDSISNFTSLGLQIWAADELNAVSFRVAVGRHVNAAYSVCYGLGTEQNSEGR